MGKIQFYIVNDQRETAPKKGYSLRPKRSIAIDQRTLAQHVETDSQIDSARVSYIMSSIVKQIREMVLNGHKVELGELGVVGLTCQAIGSDTEDAVSVKGNVKGLKFTFRPSAKLKDKMKGVSKEIVRKNVNSQDGGHAEDSVLLITSRKE